MQRFYYSCLFLLFIFVCYNSSGQSNLLKFKHMTVIDGLSHNSIISLKQDTYGYLWIGTEDGLNKYDGYNIEKYFRNEFDTTSIAGNIVRSVYDNKDGTIWICTNDGLSLYQRSTNNFMNFTHKDNDSTSLQDSYVWDITVDKQKRIWVATMKGLDILDIKSGKCKHISKGLFKSIIQDIRGNIWVGTEDGLYMFENGMYQPKIFKNEKNNANSLISNQINKIVYDGNSVLWIATSQGASKMNMLTHNFVNYKASYTEKSGNTLTHSSSNDIAIDNEKNIWIATNKGLNVLNIKTGKISQHFHSDLNPQSINNDKILSLFSDNSGLVWIGTSYGLDIYNDKKQVFEYNTTDSRQEFYTQSMKEMVLPIEHKMERFVPSNSDYSSVVEDKDGKIWLGTSQGVNVFNPKTNRYKIYLLDKKGNKNKVSNIRIDNHLNILVCSNFGLSIYDSIQDDFITYNNNLSNKYFLDILGVSQVYQDKSDRYWIIAGKGLMYAWDKSKNEIITYKNDEKDKSSISAHQLQSLVTDYLEDLWIGTRGGGLQRLNLKTGIIKTYLPSENPNSISSNMVTCMFLDSKNKLWIGTKTGGLCLYNPKTDNFETFKEREGLISNYVVSMVEDNQSYLWIATHRGLSKFNYVTKTFENFDAEDGLIFNQFSGGAATKGKDGKLYFASAGDYLSFYPEKVKQNKFPPLVVLTEFTLHNTTVHPGDNSVILQHISLVDTIDLDYDDNIFGFEFSGLHFVQPLKNQYAYKLYPFETDWIFTDARKQYVSYSNIPPGTYRFDVKAANADGVWSNKVRSITIIISPPFWERWWFRIAAIFIVAYCVKLVYKIRMRRVEERNANLEKTINERTIELQKINDDLVIQREEVIEKQNELLKITDSLQSSNQTLESQKTQILESLNNTRLLSEFGQQLSSTLNIDAINTMIYKYVSSMIDATAFGLGIYSNDKQCIDFINFMDQGNALPPFSSSLDEDNSISGWCLKNNQEIFSNDYETEYHQWIGNLRVMTHRIPKSLICLPLYVENKRIGVITVRSYQTNAYTQEDLNNLRSLASYIAIAIDNANAYNLVEEKNKQINGSIHYAKRIQKAVFPPPELMQQLMPQHFILFRPRDIVSGDFFWVKESDNKTIICVADCTGHGVPGAFMTMLGISFLNEILDKVVELNSALILNLLREKIKLSLHQTGFDTSPRDGMDMSLIILDFDLMSLQFSGANNPIMLIRDKSENLDDSSKFEIIEIDGDSMPIGIYTNEKSTFSHHIVDIKMHDRIYMYTDGFVDQTGGPKGRKFMTKNLRNLIIEHNKKSMYEQKQIFEKTLNEWQRDRKQIDDITLMGIKLAFDF